MNLRLVKIFLPLEERIGADEILRKSSVTDFWHDRISDRKILISALVPAENSEDFLDKLEGEYSDLEDFRTIIMPVEASIPRPEKEEAEEKSRERVSREELRTQIFSNAELTWTYLTLIILASIVGAVGMVESNIPMIVGAMIIAPFLGPAVGLALATVLADFDLGIRSFKTLFGGTVLALAFSLIIGVIFTVNPGATQIAMRTEVGLGDVLVSLASGSVGVLSFTTGTLTSLAGVMVAVALLPPLVAAGMLFGAGWLSSGWNAFLLFLINLICINLAGVTTFLFQKISPRRAWKSFKAKITAFLSLLIWVLLLALALLLIV